MQNSSSAPYLIINQNIGKLPRALSSRQEYPVIEEGREGKTYQTKPTDSSNTITSTYRTSRTMSKITKSWRISSSLCMIVRVHGLCSFTVPSRLHTSMGTVMGLVLLICIFISCACTAVTHSHGHTGKGRLGRPLCNSLENSFSREILARSSKKRSWQRTQRPLLDLIRHHSYATHT